MIKSVTEAHVQRAHDGSHGRQPLRLEIARRRARTRAGREKFVTQVRFGDSTALVVPWREDRVTGDRVGAGRAGAARLAPLAA
jgi:hypothetical protein